MTPSPLERERHVEVSVLMPVLNEAVHIREVLSRALSQTGVGSLEILVVDGRSSDKTTEIIAELAETDNRIRLLDNPERTTPCGLNIALRAAGGIFVARMDGHSLYPETYLATGIRRLRKGGVAWVSGPALPVGEGSWSRPVSIALSSRLGIGGGTAFRKVREEIPTASGFAGVTRRDLLERLGGWDEGWPVNQDAELAARIAKDGGRIVYVPEMGATYSPRDSLPSLSRQYRRWGFYRSKTSLRHPETLSCTHLAAPALALASLSVLASHRGVRLASATSVVAYVGAIAGVGIRSRCAHGTPAKVAARVPIALAVMHYSWGIGFIAGCTRHGPPLSAFLDLLRDPLRRNASWRRKPSWTSSPRDLEES